MNHQLTFTACVSEDAMSKVSRLFNASLDDILTELLQNARRARAKTIRIYETTDPNFGDAICIEDDGPGLNDPRTLFALGQSGWSEQLLADEDAAGMGFFALANRGARILAQNKESSGTWELCVSQEAFTGGQPIIAEKTNKAHCGVSITFPRIDRENLAAAAQHAARHYPLPVFLNGEELKREDFLAEANHIEHWNGLRIGVFHRPSPQHVFHGHNVNFHGNTLFTPLPALHQQFHQSFYARVDVGHCAGLKLVLPARKEIVQDDALGQLRIQIQKLFFRLILEQGVHSLSREDFCLSHALGVNIPEAVPILRPFVPDHADGDQSPYSAARPVTPTDLLFVGSEGPIEDQNLARAIVHSGGHLALYEPNAAFKGYAWYNRMTRTDLIGYEARFGDQVQRIPVEERFDRKDRPDHLEVILQKDGDRGPTEVKLETDALILGENYCALGEADIHVAQDAALTPGDLVEFLTAALFSPSDSYEAGTYDQQQQWFEDEAEDLAITMLQSSTAADANLIRRILQRELLWRFPKDCALTIDVAGRDITVTGLTSEAA